MKRTLAIIMLVWSLACMAQLESFFEKEEAYQHLSGVVLVTKSDSVVFQGCYGSSDGSRKNTLQTRFDIGSITKQFTAAAILHLVEEGKVELSDPINTYLGPHSSTRWKKVTIHHLLTHTGGVPSLYQTEQGLELFLPEEKPIGLTELISRFKDAKLLFSPGEEFNYSNSGYILLAAIIEQVSGQSYSDFMQERIFNEYGLRETTVGRPQTKDLATPFYGYRSDKLRPATVYDASWSIGSGGIYSTAVDLNCWINVITSQGFLSEDLRTLLLKNHTNPGYGYGWQFQAKTGIIEHDGGNAGFISMLSFNPETKESVVVLTNRSFEFGDIYNFGKSADYVRKLSESAWKSLNNEPIEELPEYKPGKAIIGTFRSSDDQSLSVTEMDTLIALRIKENYPSRLIYKTPLPGITELEVKMLDVAKYLQKTKYWSLAKYCDREMKFVSYSGMMSLVMRIVKKKVGKAVSFTPYYVDEDHGLIRIEGTERILDLIVYFNDEGEIIGIFEHGFFNLDEEVQMLAYPIGENEYYLDGMPYGEKSAILKFSDDRLEVHQMGRQIDFFR